VVSVSTSGTGGEEPAMTAASAADNESEATFNPRLRGVQA
jgi:hypothetical protein